jgi:Lrp/AsnC family transcriptional regulator, leucine-responsive regulatory protein
MATATNNRQVLDSKDRQILSLVQKDAKRAQAEIAKRVGLSAAAVNERLRKLENAGVIRRYAAVLDPRAVGLTVTAFVEVFIEHPRFEGAFIEKILRLEEVQECHHITGEFSLLIKLRVHDMEALQHLLLRQLNALEGVRQTRTVMVLSTLKEESLVATATKGEAS